MAAIRPQFKREFNIEPNVSLLFFHAWLCSNCWIVCDVENNSVSLERKKTANSRNKNAPQWLQEIRKRRNGTSATAAVKKWILTRIRFVYVDRSVVRCTLPNDVRVRVVRRWVRSCGVCVCVCASSIWKWTQHRSIYYFMYLKRSLAMRHGYEARVHSAHKGIGHVPARRQHIYSAVHIMWVRLAHVLTLPYLSVCGISDYVA